MSLGPPLFDLFPCRWVLQFRSHLAVSGGDKLWNGTSGIVVQTPAPGKWPIDPKAVSQTCMVPSPDRFLAHAMSAETNTVSHSGNGKLRRWQPEKKQMKLVAGLDEFADPSSMRSAGEGPLEGKARSTPRELLHAGEHDSTGGEGHRFWGKGRETVRDDIGVHEFSYSEGFFEQDRSRGGLAGAVGAGEGNEAGRSRTAQSHSHSMVAGGLEVTS